jgi:hypothetical protein
MLGSYASLLNMSVTALPNDLLAYHLFAMLDEDDTIALLSINSYFYTRIYPTYRVKRPVALEELLQTILPSYNPRNKSNVRKPPLFTNISMMNKESTRLVRLLRSQQKDVVTSATLNNNNEAPIAFVLRSAGWNGQCLNATLALAMQKSIMVSARLLSCCPMSLDQSSSEVLNLPPATPFNQLVQ